MKKKKENSKLVYTYFAYFNKFLSSQSVMSFSSLLTKDCPVKCKIKNVRCHNHPTRQYCKIVVDQKNSTPCTVYDIHFNYGTNNYDFYCETRPSNKYKILNDADKLILINNKSILQTTVDSKTVYKIKRGYVTFELLIELNNKTLCYSAKMIGIYIIFLSLICDLYMFFVY